MQSSLRATPPSLYAQVMGPEFARLAAPLQHFHSLAGCHQLHGWVEADAPSSLAGSILAWCLRTPRRAASGPLRFDLDAAPSREVWTRHFPGRTMRSSFSSSAAQVFEHLGPVRLAFRLVRQDAGLRMHLTGLRFLRIPCPHWLMPQIVAEESAGDGRLHFHVKASVMLAGTVASYRGYLELPGMEPAR
jgi:hypothetical protein